MPRLRPGPRRRPMLYDRRDRRARRRHLGRRRRRQAGRVQPAAADQFRLCTARGRHPDQTRAEQPPAQPTRTNHHASGHHAFGITQAAEARQPDFSVVMPHSRWIARVYGAFAAASLEGEPRFKTDRAQAEERGSVSMADAGLKMPASSRPTLPRRSSSCA